MDKRKYNIVDWINEYYPILTWDDLAERRGTAEFSEQDFWRYDPDVGFSASDVHLAEKGILHASDDGTLYHIAYLPMETIGSVHGKKYWQGEQWDHLSKVIKEILRVRRSDIGKFKWEGLTLRTQDSEEFLRAGVKGAYFLGDLTFDQVSSSKLERNVLDGNFRGHVADLTDAVVLGRIAFGNRPCSISDSYVHEVHVRSTIEPQDVSISGSNILQLDGSGKIGEVEFVKTSIAKASFDTAELQVLKIVANWENHLALSLRNANIRGRFQVERITLNDQFESDLCAFEHATFHGKVTFRDSVFPLSIFADSQLKAPIDIDFLNGTLEDAYERELKKVSLAISSNQKADSEQRRRLERACQIICDRHRQDGRKDLEQRFRRLELKTRARKPGADLSTRFFNWGYDFCSDFGRDFGRPVRGLALIWLLSSLVYAMLGVVVLDLKLIGNGPIEWGVMRDAALLASDKTFPFGASVDETELFNSKLLGAAGGSWAIVVGLLGAFQTILSGIMIFLMGLAVRTKLLIG